ncbi:TauD/TfdA family dioxygenase [Streptomyces sp. B6B3]|uniref:TauD/TfdA family dioxygenase n=1 Tax=Streptomyces sp. B6B3 TaxID=3153570 RepID=UPI00325F56B6
MASEFLHGADEVSTPTHAELPQDPTLIARADDQTTKSSASSPMSEGPPQMEITDLQGTPLGKSEVVSRLDADGVILLSETGPADFVRELGHLFSSFRHPHAGPDGWTVIRTRDHAIQDPALRGFTSSALEPHTDRSFLSHPPAFLCFLLESDSRTGGDALLVDSAPVYRDYSDEMLAELQTQLWLRDRSGVGRQPLVSVAEGLCINRFRNDRVGSPRPLSPAGRTLLSELVRAINAPHRIPLRRGEGYLLHNHRVLHGRSAYSGNRQGVRLLAFLAPQAPRSWLNRGFRLRDESRPGDDS